MFSYAKILNSGCNCTGIFNTAVKCEGLIKAAETSKTWTSQNHSLDPK